MFLDGTARLWDAQTGRQLRRFEGHTEEVYSVAFSPDGRQVLTGSRDGTARLWDAQTGHPICVFYHLHKGGWVTITPQGYFLSDGRSETREVLHVKDPDTGQGRGITDAEWQAFHRPDLLQQLLQRGPEGPGS